MTNPEALRALAARIRSGEPETIELRTAIEDALGIADHMVSPRFMLSDEDDAISMVPEGFELSTWGDYGFGRSDDCNHVRLDGDDCSLTRSAPGSLGWPRLTTATLLELRAAGMEAPNGTI